MSPLRKQFEAEAKECLVARGFKRHNTGYGCYYYTQNNKENEKIAYFLGITSYAVPKHLFVAPQIGVRYENVEQLVKKLMSDNTDCVFTFSQHVGYLMPQDSWFKMDYHEGVEKEKFWNELMHQIENYGDPYAENLLNIDNLITEIENVGIGTCEQLPILRLPILYYIRGYEVSRGLKYIERVLRKEPIFGNRIFTDNYIEQYKKLYETPPTNQTTKK